jgi:Pyridoxamine 5'-phosphate oxidase
MRNRDLARLAYVAKDGTPRVVPIGFTWNGYEVVMCTATNAPKLGSLRRNAAVALTIDTEVYPPRVLLIRGKAVLDEVDGIPDEYLQASGTYKMTPEQRVEWEAGVRSLYDSMVRIVVKPTWAKLIDFDETLPTLSRSWFAGGKSGSRPSRCPPRHTVATKTGSGVQRSVFARDPHDLAMSAVEIAGWFRRSKP